jgi:hypothetical protein
LMASSVRLTWGAPPAPLVVRKTHPTENLFQVYIQEAHANFAS